MELEEAYFNNPNIPPPTIYYGMVRGRHWFGELEECDDDINDDFKAPQTPTDTIGLLGCCGARFECKYDCECLECKGKKDAQRREQELYRSQYEAWKRSAEGKAHFRKLEIERHKTKAWNHILAAACNPRTHTSTIHRLLQRYKDVMKPNEVLQHVRNRNGPKKTIEYLEQLVVG